MSVYLRTPFVQSCAMDSHLSPADATQRLGALRAELEPLGWKLGAMTHDDIQITGPEQHEVAAREALARHLPGGACRWAFKLADGSHVVGPVQGSGGVIELRGGRDRLLKEIARARAGRMLGIYEPKAGHARVFPKYSAFGQGEPVDVDLRTAVLL